MKNEDTMIFDDGDRLMSLEEVQARLRSSKTVVKALVDFELLPALNFGKNRRVRKVTLNAFLEKYEGTDIYEVIDQMRVSGESG